MKYITEIIKKNGKRRIKYTNPRWLLKMLKLDKSACGDDFLPITAVCDGYTFIVHSKDGTAEAEKSLAYRYSFRKRYQKVTIKWIP